MNPRGVRLREARDSTDHPDSIPVVVFFDVTGSMGEIPRVLQTKLSILPQALSLGGVRDVQILFGATGDEDTDTAPLQVSQFESDVRMDDHLNKIFIEGNGGGNGGESYGLALHWTATHTAHDRWDRRRRKGYLFLTGDERAHSVVSSTAINKFVGDHTGDVTIADAIRNAQTRYHLYFLHVNTRSAQLQGSLREWQRLLPERVVSLTDASTVCETIVAIVARNEGADARTVADSLARAGASAEAVRDAAGAALAVRADGSMAPGRASGRLPDSARLPFPGAARL